MRAKNHNALLQAANRTLRRAIDSWLHCGSALVLLIGLAPSGYHTNVQAQELSAIPANFQEIIHQSWEKHLLYRLDDPKVSEWTALELLQLDPLNEDALTTLFRAFVRNEETVMAGAIAYFAADIGITNRVIKPAAYRRQMPEHFHELTSLPREMRARLRAVDDLTQIQTTEAGYTRLPNVPSTMIRKLMQEGGHAPECLRRLAIIYKNEQQPVLALLTANLYLHFLPGDQDYQRIHREVIKQLNVPRLFAAFDQEFVRNTQPIGNTAMPAQIRQALAQGSQQEAIAYAQKWAEKEPTNPATWQVLGDILFNAGHTALAIRATERATKFIGHTPTAYLILARSYAQTNQEVLLRQALKEYKRRVPPPVFVRALAAPDFKNFPELKKDFNLK